MPMSSELAEPEAPPPPRTLPDEARLIVAPSPVTERLARARAELVAILDRDPLGDDEAIYAWHHAHALAADLAVIVDDLGAAAIKAMDNLTEALVRTDQGFCHVGQTGSVDHWRGHELLGELGAEHYDTATGEKVQAIPVTTLREILPGCSHPNLTSSRWSTTALGKYLRWSKYRNREQPRKVMRHGIGR